ncbi:unnamed protein product [Leptidea sinapis]|uniref:Uncharacterized protein n=1 Tax=Leptidea sinapis TaxID=189913 RepID=A0A5E4PQ88_9NEOP|nr:unnamed protein product [Leptidea sinapis]
MMQIKTREKTDGQYHPAQTQAPARDLHDRFDATSDFAACRTSRLIEASIEPATNLAVKRSRDADMDVERKRYRVAGHAHYSQTVQ